jgi:hypothetical protein
MRSRYNERNHRRLKLGSNCNFQGGPQHGARKLTSIAADQATTGESHFRCQNCLVGKEMAIMAVASRKADIVEVMRPVLVGIFE